MSSIRIGHITDLHFRHHIPGSSHKHKNRSREVPIILKKALNKLKKETVDILVITGDVVDTPGILLKHSNYYMDVSAPFRRMVRKDYLTIRSLLDKSGIPWIVIPGNKDEPELFAEIWGDQPLVRDVRGYRFVSFHDRQWDSSQPRRFDRERLLMEEVLGRIRTALPRSICSISSALLREQIKIKHVYKEAENIRKSLQGIGQGNTLSVRAHYHPGISRATERIGQNRMDFRTSILRGASSRTDP